MLLPRTSTLAHLFSLPFYLPANHYLSAFPRPPTFLSPSISFRPSIPSLVIPSYFLCFTTFTLSLLPPSLTPFSPLHSFLPSLYYIFSFPSVFSPICSVLLSTNTFVHPPSFPLSPCLSCLTTFRPSSPPPVISIGES